MTDLDLLALMYDFYNKHELHGQNDDINYYIKQIKKYKAKDILIIGAGTGRVAIPLSKYANVTALDFDQARLNRLKNKCKNINIICEDFLKSDLKQCYDLIIIPYSTLQFDNDVHKLNEFLSNLYNILNDNTTLIFDVSESFNTKKETQKKLLFQENCEEIGEDVAVYYTSKRYEQYIEFLVEYKLLESNHSVIENERYYYYNQKILEDFLKQNNISIIKIDDGYGKEGFKHKHLYHCKRWNNERK